jgi:hypothetical protein
MRNIFICLLTLGLLSISCGDGKDSHDDPEVGNEVTVPETGKPPETTIQLYDQELFDKQRQLWLEQNLQNYSFSLLVFDSSGGLFLGTVVAKDGIVDSVLDSSGKEIHPDDYRDTAAIPFVASITDIYAFLNRVRERMEDPEGLQLNPELIYRISKEIEYDDSYHFVKNYNSISVQRYKDKPDEKLAGNSSSYIVRISDFTVDP